MYTDATVTEASLLGIDCLASLPATARAALVARTRGRRYAAGEPVLRCGESTREVYFVASGVVRVIYFSAVGREVVFRDMPPGSMFGELSALDGRTRSADVHALDDTFVVVLHHEQFHALLAAEPEFARCPLFDGMTSYQVKKLVLLSDLARFDSGDHLIRQGDVAEGMFVLLKGTAAITLERDGAAVVIDRARPGDIVGEVGFAGSGARRTASVVAATPVSAVRLDARRMQHGVRFYPGLARQVYRNIAKLLGQRLQQSHQRLLDGAQPRALPKPRLRPARPPRRYIRPTLRR